jgi:3-oxoacyl-[acyl-carrier protein] reductase
MTFENKVVLITGANAGIGKAATILFAESKAKVIAIDLASQIDEDLNNRLNDLKTDFSYHTCDVSSNTQVEELIEQLISQYIKIDILINNAGILGPRKKTENYPFEDFDKVIDVNIKGVYYLMKAVLPHFSHNSSGVIVNTASVAGHLGMAGHIAYSASKHAVIGMTKTVAIEYAKKGIRVNAVCPGFTQTAMLDTADSDEQYKEMLKFATPMKRFGEATEIAEAILFLASDKNSFMTGQCIILDGGLSVQ